MTVTRDQTLPPTHPGAILGEDVLPALDMPVQTAAKLLGVSRQTLHRIAEAVVDEVIDIILKALERSAISRLHAPL